MGLENPNPQPPSEIPLFSKYAAEWLDMCVKVNCKRSTQRLNKQIIDDHLEPAFGEKEAG